MRKKKMIHPDKAAVRPCREKVYTEEQIRKEMAIRVECLKKFCVRHKIGLFLRTGIPDMNMCMLDGKEVQLDRLGLISGLEVLEKDHLCREMAELVQRISIPDLRCLSGLMRAICRKEGSVSSVPGPE